MNCSYMTWEGLRLELTRIVQVQESYQKRSAVLCVPLSSMHMNSQFLLGVFFHLEK